MSLRDHYPTESPYAPPDYYDTLAILKAKLRAAYDAQEVHQSAVPSEVRSDIATSMLYDPQQEVRTEGLPEPVAAFIIAAQQEGELQRQVREKKNNATKFLANIVGPYCMNPPRDMWAVGEEKNDIVTLVPFTQAELAAIKHGQDAYALLRNRGEMGSGTAREFLIETQFFPRTAAGLEIRPRAVWGIFTAAISAQEGMAMDAGTAWEPQGAEADAFQTISELPEHLLAHPRG